MTAKKNSSQKKGVSTGTIVAISAGVIAAAAAGYFFFGPQGKRNRAKVKGWMIKMKGEVVEKMENAKEMSQTVYNGIVDSVAAPLIKSGKVDIAAVRSYVHELKRQWKGLSTHAAKGQGNAKSRKTSSKRTGKQGS